MTAPAQPPRSDRGAPNRRRRLAALIGLLAALTLTGTVTAPAAFAHTELDSSNPADGGTVDQPPTSIQLVFAESVRGADPVFTITVAGFDPVEAPAVIDGATVTADLSGVDLPGLAASYPVSWEVGYRLVALDGDAFSGDITFDVAAGPAPATSASPETTAPVTSEVTTTTTGTTVTTSAAEPSTAETSTPATSTAATPTADSSTGATASTTSSTGESTPGPTGAAAADSAGTGSGSGWWWFAGVVVVVLIAGGAYWYVRSRRSAPPAA